jgi:hypothetical protein
MMRWNGEHPNRCLSAVIVVRRSSQGDRRFVRGIPTEKLKQFSIKKEALLSPARSKIRLQRQLILQQKEVDEDSGTMVVMEDDAVLDTYSPSDEPNVKTRLLGHGFGICNMVRVRKNYKRKRSNCHFRSETNSKMLIIVVKKGDMCNMVPTLETPN